MKPHHSSIERGNPAAVLPPTTPWLVIHAGTQPACSVALDAPVVRVGSHASCGIRLADAEPHALTIEQRPRGVRVHNRTARRLQLDEESLEPGTAAIWTPETVLVLGPSLSVRLAHAPTPAVSECPEPSAETPAVEAPPAAYASRPALVLTMVLLMMATWVVGLLFQSRGPVPARIEEDRLAVLVRDLRQCGPEGHYIAQELQLALQDQNLGRDLARARSTAPLERLDPAQSWTPEPG